MGFSGIFKGVAGGLGGASRGFAAAMPDVMAMQQRRGEQADLKSYRDATLAQDQTQSDRAFAETQTQNRYSRAMDRRTAHTARLRADAERIRAETDATRATMASRGDATRELYDARLARARSAANGANQDASPGELDRLARLQGFTDYGQVVGVLQTAGEQVPLAGSIPNPGFQNPKSLETFPGETSYGRLGRLRGAYGKPISELSDEAGFQGAEIDQDGEDASLREQIRRVRGG